MHGFLTVLAFFFLLASPVTAQPTPVSASWELATLPGSGLVAVLWLTPGQGFKAYANDPGQTGLPTRAEAVLTPSGKSLTVLYPPGKTAQDLYEKDKTVKIYDSPTPLFIPVPHDAPPGFGVQAKVNLLACTDSSCWPMSLETDFSSKEVPNPAPADRQPWWSMFAGLVKEAPATSSLGVAAKAIEAAPGWTFAPRSLQPHLEVNGLLKALPLAFLAGFLLNLMPCVLPVACLKLSGLLAVCREGDPTCDRFALIRQHNIFFSLGVLAYFCVLAVLLGLAEMAWGELFQQPGLILGAAVVLFALGLSLFGVFHLPVIDLKLTPRPGHSPRSQALATGFLATLLATPCSGPFLGGVLAWTLMQPVAVVMTVFVGIGMGMASPYLLLAVRPELTKFVPRPGPWMSHLEKLAGFLIMGTCLYFLVILPAALLPASLVALLVTAFACHAWGSWTNLSQGAFTRWTIRSVAAAAAVAACVWALSVPAAESAAWEPFDKATFHQMLGKEDLLVDFTADWCPTCKALEKTVLRPPAVARLQKRYGFKAIRVDLTRESPEAMALLRSLGSASIPLAAVFPKGADSQRPVVLRDLFTSGQLEEALEMAFGQVK
ncbi:MAG: thioredoxin family protein [Desulfovibrio sp.]|nr:thioredoxin family protein [Desulfovibrio sp.]MBI4959838.1 thioredoxin family protein [Desulfovibrio sp.]